MTHHNALNSSRKHHIFRILSVYTLLCISSEIALLAQDWPKWQGPNENGLSSEMLPDMNQLQLDWKAEVGLGYSGLIVAEGKVFTLGHDGKSKETLHCFDLNSGKSLWKVTYNGDLIPKLHAGGPNASPLIEHQKVYSISKDGQILCLNIQDGKEIWKASLPKILNVDVPNFGFACSPLIIDGQLILSQGKTVSMDPETGKVKWISDTAGEASYATPRLMILNGKNYLVAMSSKGANIIDFSNGKNLAQFTMNAKYDMIATTPVLLPEVGEFFASTSQTAARLKFDGKNLTPIWSIETMRNSFSNSIYVDGYLYGVDGPHKSNRTKLVCLDAKTGKMAWTQEKTGHGSVIGAKNSLCFFSEDGELVKLEINPKTFKATSKKKVLSGICWTPPTLSNGKLLVRNEEGTVLCLSAK